MSSIHGSAYHALLIASPGETIRSQR